MVKFAAAIGISCFLAFAASSNEEFERFRAVESYDAGAGVVITPIRSPKGDVCGVTIEKRHYSGSVFDLNADMTKAQVVAFFDELVPSGERGLPKFGGMEYFDVDGGTRSTRVYYEKVTLHMFGEGNSQKFISALIEWNKPGCGNEVNAGGSMKRDMK